MCITPTTHTRSSFVFCLVSLNAVNNLVSTMPRSTRSTPTNDTNVPLSLWKVRWPGGSCCPPSIRRRSCHTHHSFLTHRRGVTCDLRPRAGMRSSCCHPPRRSISQLHSFNNYTCPAEGRHRRFHAGPYQKLPPYHETSYTIHPTKPINEETHDSTNISYFSFVRGFSLFLVVCT